MTRRELTIRELNRTTLGRQLLLQGHDMSLIDAMNRLIGLQSQIPNPPYIGLWTRLEQFSKVDLTQAIERREIVRAPLMRSTLHLVTAETHQEIRMSLQSALERGYRSFFGSRRKSIDVRRIVNAIKPMMEDKALSMGDIREFLLMVQPNANPEAMAYAIRTFLPVVQVPPAGTWGAGTQATYVPSELLLGKPHKADLRSLFERYLAAFGPASVMDFQAWSGLTNSSKEIAKWQDDFSIYQHPNGRELWDLPELDILSEDSQVPEVIFLPEYENALISYKDRERILPDEHAKKVFLSAGRVASTILIDGFVGASWKAGLDKGRAKLTVTLFDSVLERVRTAIKREAEALLAFYV